METITKYLVGFIALVALVLGVVNYMNVAAPSLGAAGQDFLNQVSFYGGRIERTSIATSSAATAETLSANELIAWANAGVVSYTPNLAPVTITLPASSTLKAFLPQAGDRQTFCVRNATSTGATAVTFAGGLGTKLLVASSSATSLGSAAIYTGKVGCFTFVREVATSTAYDIDALFTVYQ